MAFFPTENRLGLPNSLGQIDSVATYTPATGTATNAQVQPGTIVRAQDPILGGGEFIYLPGCAGTVVGSLVSYDPVNLTTALVPITTKNLDLPVAVAMSANSTTTNYGWYQIEGAAVIKKTAVKVNPSVQLYGSATTGRVMPTAASGRQLMNARTVNLATVASATSTITALINRPFMQGAVL